MRKPSAKSVLADIANEAYGRIVEMTPRQRRAALKVLDGLTTTNCGWTLYELRGSLREFIRMATPLPKRKRRKEGR